jgi:hypothetical protein
LLKADKTGSAVFQFSVDSTGRQTQVALAGNMPPNEYEALVLLALGHVGAQWLPKMAEGRPTAAAYQVRVVATLKESGLRVTVEPLGD